MASTSRPSDVTPLIDNVMLKPRMYLLSLQQPVYKSEYARRVDAAFSDSSPPAPMVYSVETGLVLYERVMTTKQETHLLTKLTKPKVVNHLPAQPDEHGKRAWQGTGRSAQQSPGQGGAEAPTPGHEGSASSSSSASSGSDLRRPRPKRYYNEDQESEEVKAAREYFSRERATISSGILSHGGRLQRDGRSRSGPMFSPTGVKPPLRL